MMGIDYDKFLPPVVKLSTTPYCTYISSEYNGTHYNDSTQQSVYQHWLHFTSSAGQ